MDFLAISDALISASSEHSSVAGAKRVRMDNYFDFSCAWAAGQTDVRPWVQFNMGEVVTVWGVIMKPRCDPPYDVQRVLSYQLEKSDNGNSWSEASDVITADYSFDETSISWLSHPAKAQYWRIAVISSQVHPSMKADLIGKGRLQCLLW